MGLLSIFGYDKGKQDARVDAAKLARDQAYLDAYKIERAADLLLKQIPGLQAQAGNIFAASEQAMAIGRMNASHILQETAEYARRRGNEQRAVESIQRARAAASGIAIDTGGSADIYMDKTKQEHGKEISWINRAGKSQADIAVAEGERAALEARAAAEGVLAGIQAVQSTAERYRAEAGSLRTSSDVAVAEARAARSSSRSGAFLNILNVGTSIATTGLAFGWWGPAAGAAAGGSAAGGLSTGTKVALGVAGATAGLAALSNILNSGSHDFKVSDLVTPMPEVGKIPGVNAGTGFDTSKAPQQVAYKPPAFLPSAEKATGTQKKQFLVQQRTDDKFNIFGASANPLAVGA